MRERQSSWSCHNMTGFIAPDMRYPICLKVQNIIAEKPRNVLLLHRVSVRTFWHFIWYCVQIFETIMMMFKLTWCWQWRRARMLRFIKHVKICFKRDWRIWCRFVPNLLEYICLCTNNYFTVIYFDKFIAKIKWCSFFARQCICISSQK